MNHIDANFSWGSIKEETDENLLKKLYRPQFQTDYYQKIIKEEINLRNKKWRNKMNQPIKVIVEVVFDNYPTEKEMKRTIKDYVDSKDFKPEMEYVHEEKM